jgi:hypothetical protein
MQAFYPEQATECIAINQLKHCSQWGQRKGVVIMAGEAEARAVIEIEEKALKALLEMLKLSGKGLGHVFKMGEKAIDGVRDIANNKTMSGGEVKYSKLQKDARANREGLSAQDAVPRSDVAAIMRKCKDYGIPASIIDTDKQSGNLTVAYRSTDSELIQRIMAEVAKEKIAKSPDGYSSFTINEWEVKPMQDEILKNDLSANIVKDTDGKFHCVYANSDERVFETIHRNLNANSKTYQAKEPSPVDDVKVAEEVKLPNESVLLADYAYYHMQMKTGDDVYIVLDNKGNAAFLDKDNPDKSRESLSNLGMDSKTIDAMMKKHDEVLKDLSDKETELKVEREAGGKFTVSGGDKTEEYTFADKDNVITALQEDFGLSPEEAEQIYNQAEEQNVIEEELNNEAKNTDTPDIEDDYDIAGTHEPKVETPDIPEPDFEDLDNG